MTEEVVVAGFGGQGVMLAGQILCEAARSEGKQVTWMPSYGPEMRGGTANCQIVISDEPIGSPFVTEPHSLLALNLPSLEKFVDRVRVGGIVVYNSSLCGLREFGCGVSGVAVAATERAIELGNIRAANMFVMGAWVSVRPVVSVESLMAAAARAFKNRGQEIMELNLSLIREGLQIALNT